jgi:hypothetical protein
MEKNSDYASAYILKRGNAGKDGKMPCFVYGAQPAEAHDTGSSESDPTSASKVQAPATGSE